MSKQTVLWLFVLASIVLLGCSASREQKGQDRPTSVSMEASKLEVVIAELKGRYKSATLEQDRRAVCLRAIDENAIHRGSTVSTIDEIFDTHFATDLPSEKEGIRKAGILFAPQFSSLEPADETRAVGYVGSYIDFDYDSNGAIQNYYISNLHKGGSRRTDGKEPISVGQLAGLYQAAKSERERRDVALRAIDEGVIQTFGPVNLSTVDAIFRTHLASQLPTRKEVTRKGIVDFASSTTTAAPEKAEASGPKGWYMAVEYYHDGSIANYYLTNVRK